MTGSLNLVLWLAALYGYLVLFISFLATRKNRLITSFTVLIGLFFFWILSSVCTMLSVQPGPVFWLRASQIFLMLIPISLYMFLKIFFHENLKDRISYILVALSIIILIPVFRDCYVTPNFAVPKGSISDIMAKQNPCSIIPIVVLIFVFTECYRVILRNRHREYFKPMAIGMFIFWLGNILAMIPNPYVPTSLIGGIINFAIFAHIIYREKIVRLKLFISHSTLALFGFITVVAVSLIFFWREWTYLTEYRYAFLTIIIATSGATTIITMIYNWLSNRFFFSRVDFLMKCNTRYHERLLGHVEKKELILQDFSDMMKESFGDIAFTTYLREGSCYSQKPGSMSLNMTDFPDDSRIVKWIATLQGPDRADPVLTLHSEARRELNYAIKQKRIRFVIPLRSKKELLGFVLAGGDRLSLADKTELETLASIASTTSMALESSLVLEKLEHDAAYDQMTQLYNRYTMNSLLQKKIDERQNFTFLLINIDDMKLFNMVYSLSAGDELLRSFADTLRSCCDGRQIPGRISGKTFGVIIDGSRSDGIAYDRKLREEFALISRDTIRRNMTFSTGLLEADSSSARTPNTLLNLVRTAVVLAKKCGKNQLKVFESYMMYDPVLRETGFRVKTAEAISAALDLRDHHTYDHSNNVASYARSLAAAAGLNDLEQQIIYEAGLIHDIGKISIPDTILLKPGKLTDEEYEIMKTHVARSEEVIITVPHGYMMLPYAMAHHERWDGKGYPNGTGGEDIPIGGRCLAIADSFDAMISRRVYRKPMSISDALREITKCAGTQFDPRLAHIFVKLVESGEIIPRPSGLNEIQSG